MSEALERKIVELQFDNAEFERRVAKSMKTIESLKKELDFDESAKSLDRLEKAANDISFKGLEKETTSLGDLFDWSSIFKISLLQKVADQVISTATRMLKSMTIDNVTAGMTKYEMKTKSVQTIMAATGKSVAEVEKVLERLNYYTDMTSYDFADMTNNIGKFTSAGIDLETAEVAMEGIANWAAVSGQEIAGASRAMYNLSQALSVGHVKLIDWKSIENANMATKEFKEYVIETAIAMGKLKQVGDKVGKTLKGTAVDYKNFSQTLSEGWFDNDVLIATLTQYADTNTEIGSKAYDAARKALTFTQAMQAVRDSISTGWMKTWQLLFGDVEEAGTFFTNLCDSIIEVTERIDEARNNLLQEWRDFTSIFTDENGNHYKGKDMASLIFHTVWDTIVSVGAAISRAMEMVANPSSVLFGNGGFDMHGWTVAVENIEDLATGNMLGKITDGILGFVGAIREFIYGESIFGGQRIVKLVHIFTGLFSILDIGRQIIGSILGFVGRIVKYLTPLVDAALEIGSALGDVFYMIDLSLRSGGLKALGDSLFEFLRPALNWLNSVGTKIKDWVLKQIEKIPDLLEKITKKITKFLDSLRKWGKRVTDVFKPILRPIEYIWSVIKGWFSGEGLENMNLWDKIQEIWSRITNTDFSKWKISFQLAFADIKNRASTLWNVLKDTVKQKWGIDLSWVDEAVSTIRQKWDAFTTWWQSTAIYKWFTESDKETGLTGFQTVAYAIGDAFKNAWDFFTEPDANGETGFQRWKKNLLDRCNEIKVAIEKWQGWTDIGKFFSSIWDWFTKAQWQGEQRDEHGNLAGFEFFGTGVQYAVFKVKNWFVQAAKDVETWWNSDNPFAVVFRTIANGVWTGLTTIWNFFTDDNTDTGKTQFQNWIDELYGHYEDIKKAVTEWKGWDDISDFFGGIWDYFTKAQWQGEQRDEHGNLAGFEFYGTGFEYTIYQVKQWFDKVGGEIDAWWNGDNIIRTAFETIKGWFAGIVTWFKEEALPRNGVGEGPSFEAFFVNVGNDIKAAWEKITAPGTFLGGLKNTVGDLFSSVWDWFTKRQVHGSKTDEEGNLAGWEFVGTGAEYAVFKIKNWFIQTAKDIEEWYNSSDPFATAFRTIITGIGTGLETAWKWFNDEMVPRKPEDEGKSAFELFFINIGRDIEDAWNRITAPDTFLGQMVETVKGFFKPIWEAIFGTDILKENGPSEEEIEKAWKEYQDSIKNGVDDAVKDSESEAEKMGSNGRRLIIAAGPLLTDFKFEGGEKVSEEVAESVGMTKEEFTKKYIDEHTGIIGFLNSVKETLGGWWEAAKPILEPVKQFFVDLWDTIRKYFTEVNPDTGKTQWKETLEEVVSFLESTWNKVSTWGGWETVGDFFSRIWTAISGFVSGLFTTEKTVEEESGHGGNISRIDDKMGKTISLFDTMRGLFEGIGEVLGLSGITELEGADRFLGSLADIVEAVVTFAARIINFIAAPRVWMMLIKYSLVKFGFTAINGVLTGVSTIIVGGIGALIGKIPWLAGGLATMTTALPIISQFMLSLAAMIAAVAFVASVVSLMEWDDVYKLGAVMLMLGVVLKLISNKNNGLLGSGNTITKNVSTADHPLWKLVTTIATIGLVTGALIVVINTLAAKADDLNKINGDTLGALGTLIFDMVSSMALVLVAAALAGRLLSGKSVDSAAIGKIVMWTAIIFLITMALATGAGAIVNATEDVLTHGSQWIETMQKGAEAISMVSNTIGGLIGALVGGIVGGYKHAVSQWDQDIQKEEMENTAESLALFSEIMNDVVGRYGDTLEDSRFGHLVDYVERLSHIADRLYTYSVGEKIKQLGEFFKSFADNASQATTMIDDNKISTISDLVSIISMITTLLIEIQSESDKLKEIMDDTVFDEIGDFLFDVFGKMLSPKGSPRSQYTVAYELGKVMDEVYKGMTDSHTVNDHIGTFAEVLKGSVDAYDSDFKHIGASISAAISEGMAEGGSLVVDTSKLLALSAIGSYNKWAASADATTDKIYQTLEKLGFSVDDESSPYNLLKSWTEQTDGTVDAEDLLGSLFDFDISKIADINSFIDMEALKNSFSGLSSEFESMITGDENTAGLLTEMESALRGENGLGSIMDSGIGDMTSAITSSDTIAGFTAAGKNLILGLANGLRNNVKDATEAAAFVARQVLDKFHQVWRLGSPSKETEQFGEWLIEGLEIGITDEGSTFIQIIAKIGDTIGEAISTAIVNAIQEAFGLVHKEANDVFASGIITEEPPLLDASKMGDVVEEIEERFENGEITYIPIGAKLVTYDSSIGPLPDTTKKVSEILDGELEKWQDSLGLYKPGEKKSLIDWDQIKLNDQKEADKAGEETKKSFNDAVRASLTNSIKGIFDLADSDLTYEPVIRPIIDWSNVTANVGYGGRILSGMPGLTGGTYAAGTLEETMKIQNGKNNGDLYNVVVDIRDKVDQLDRDVMNMKIVLNTGVLAGELVNDIDNELGQRVLNNGRAN